MITTAAEVVIAPRSSVDLAVKLAEPITLVQLTEYGETASTPIETLLTKNSTWATVPSGSEAFAETVTAAGAVNNEVTNGAVKDAVGGRLFTTEIDTALALAVKPKSSVATAVIVWLPKVEV